MNLGINSPCCGNCDHVDIVNCGMIPIGKMPVEAAYHCEVDKQMHFAWYRCDEYREYGFTEEAWEELMKEIRA